MLRTQWAAPCALRTGSAERGQWRQRWQARAREAGRWALANHSLHWPPTKGGMQGQHARAASSQRQDAVAVHMKAATAGAAVGAFCVAPNTLCRMPSSAAAAGPPGAPSPAVGPRHPVRIASLGARLRTAPRPSRGRGRTSEAAEPTLTGMGAVRTPPAAEPTPACSSLSGEGCSTVNNATCSQHGGRQAGLVCT